MKRSMYQRQANEPCEEIMASSTLIKAHKRPRVSIDLNAHPTETLKSLYFSSVKEQSTTTRPPQQHNDSCLDHYTLAVVNAIRSNDIETLRQMLEQGHSFQACNNQGEYLIHLACRRSNLATIQFLLDEAHVNPNVCDDLGRTILHDLCWRPQVATPLLEFLLPHLQPQLLIRKDVRGHAPFDYSRSHDWPQWNAFLTQSSTAQLICQPKQPKQQQQQQ
uniref:Uncharacterized protein n=1 Tax=Entomoneis paludosa TaxID=265537 RepID=A0A7S2Y6A1_9STRA|mmetsp:Transcript_15184/g.31300  ORF Transcript_15184/g.31300 Transcript_15184/m.31300 type:complete len:219 (+) Transcript_15184:81-737(+)